MSIDDVLNVRSIYGGAVTIAPDEHLGDVHRMEHQKLKLSSHWILAFAGRHLCRNPEREKQSPSGAIGV